VIDGELEALKAEHGGSLEEIFAAVAGDRAGDRAGAAVPVAASGGRA
jgi:hypothetical protein